jgi:hypothetical protein
VRFGYGNQLLALLGLHWLFIAVLDLFGFPPNFYERHYLFFLGSEVLALERLRCPAIALAKIPAPLGARPEGRLVGSPVFGLKRVTSPAPKNGLLDVAALCPTPKGDVFLLDGVV